MTSNATCLVCQNPRLRFMYVAKGYEIVGCDRCGFCQVAEPPTDGELERLYANLHVSHNKFRDEQAALRENLTRLRFMQEFVAPGGVVLDAGCATGDFLALAKSHYTAYGVDISSGAIEQAKARLPDIATRLSSLKLESISQEWPKFDAICLWDVIEHVRDPVSVCRTLTSLLNPGGHLFLSTPNMGALTAKVMKQHWAFMIPPLHLGYFSQRSIAYLFAKQLSARILTSRTRGKWTSLAFLFYKINQISRWLAPPALLDWLSRSRLGRLKLYIPTNDIIYLVAEKSEQQR
jgi:2-polyprenyl-3-methyl-5-hydroxy-6-metoxy-1,4-benzoquinol methylase